MKWKSGKSLKLWNQEANQETKKPKKQETKNQETKKPKPENPINWETKKPRIPPTPQHTDPIGFDYRIL